MMITVIVVAAVVVGEGDIDEMEEIEKMLCLHGNEAVVVVVVEEAIEEEEEVSVIGGVEEDLTEKIVEEDVVDMIGEIEVMMIEAQEEEVASEGEIVMMDLLVVEQMMVHGNVVEEEVVGMIMTVLLVVGTIEMEAKGKWLAAIS